MERMIYEPNKYFKMGLSVWPMMVKELWGSRELVWRLFLRNLSSKYKQALLGFAWAVVVPFIAIGTFWFLNRMGVIAIGPTGVPYPLFALVGLSVWQLFSGGISSGCQSLVEAGDMIAKVSFPREVLVLASLAQAVFEFLVKIVLLACVCIFYGFLPPVTALFFPFALFPLIMLTLGLSLFLSLVNAVFRDTAQAINVLMMFLMFLTPVLYPAAGDKAWIFQLNPLTPLVSVPRDLFLYGTAHDLTGYFVSSVLSVLVFLCAWRIFHLVETKIPERL